MIRPVPRMLVAVLVCLMATSGCTTTGGAADPSSGAITPSPTGPGTIAVSQLAPPLLPSPAESVALLANLPAATRLDPTGIYERDAFGTAWSDLDSNGCNQRDDVLLRDGVPGTVRVADQGACDHDVLAGTWHDPYTGRVLEMTDLKDPVQAQAVQIDHVVPLAEAWVSGAASWSADRRHAFANDLDGLVASDGPTNAAKSDDDPAAWRPRKAFQCDYARRWIMVKAAWGLAADRSERRALREILVDCA